jgi:alanyl-tRNA synthetase
VSRDEAEAMLTAGQIRKLPDRQGTILLIDTADYDDNACGGTHVRSTGQIGGLLMRTVEKVSRGVRVEFLCGSRAIRTACTDFAILGKTSALLSTGAKELAATVERMLIEGKASAKERQKLREELTAFQGAKLAMEVPIENGLRLVVGAWKDRDRDYVKLLASRTAAAAAHTAVILCAAEADRYACSLPAVQIWNSTVARFCARRSHIWDCVVEDQLIWPRRRSAGTGDNIASFPKRCHSPGGDGGAQAAVKTKHAARKHTLPSRMFGIICHSIPPFTSLCLCLDPR